MNLHCIVANWPSLRSSNIQLLGLFGNTVNRSEWSVHSRSMFKAAVILSQEYNITIDKQYIGWQSEETDGSTIGILSKTCEALSTSNIFGIIGPPLSREARLLADFGRSIGIPIISYSVTDSIFSDRTTYPNFYRMAPSEKSTALAIAKLFIRFNWTSCILIYQSDEYGLRNVHIINEIFNVSNINIKDKILFDIDTSRTQSDLKFYLSNSASRIVVVWAEQIYVDSIVKHALQSDVIGSQFIWILSSTISLDNFDNELHEKLSGLFAVEPATGNLINMPVNTTLLNQAYRIWKHFEPESFPEQTNVNNYALYTFDATWLLIQSLEKFYSKSQSANSSALLHLAFNKSSVCFHQRFIHSHQLLETINSMEFLGISGLVKFYRNATDRIDSTYYNIQNIQLSSSNKFNFVSVFEYSDINGKKIFKEKSPIVWPGNLHRNSNGQPSLEGINIRIGIIGPTPFIIPKSDLDGNKPNETIYIGYILDLIDLLKRETKFNPRIEKLVLLNRTYTDLIRGIENNDFDILIGDVTVTSGRRGMVDFSSPIFDNSLQIIMRKTPAIKIDLLSFIRPFSPNLWLLVLGTCIYAGLLLCLIERNDNQQLQNRSIISQIALSIWYSFGNLVGYGVDFQVNTAAGRLLTAGLYMLSLTLVVTYTAHLASDLTILKSKTLISGINDIKTGKIPFGRIGIRPETASEDYYLREISSGVKNYHRISSQKELYDSLLNGTIDVSFIDSGTAEFITNNVHCDLTLIGQDFDKSTFGVAMAKNWLYTENLDVAILSLREKGELNHLREKWFRRKGCPDATQTSTAMSAGSMGGLFLIFAVLTILSILQFLWSNRSKLKNFVTKLRRRK